MWLWLQNILTCTPPQHWIPTRKVGNKSHKYGPFSKVHAAARTIQRAFHAWRKDRTKQLQQELQGCRHAIELAQIRLHYLELMGFAACLLLLCSALATTHAAYSILFNSKEAGLCCFRSLPPGKGDHEALPLAAAAKLFFASSPSSLCASEEHSHDFSLLSAQELHQNLTRLQEDVRWLLKRDEP